MPRHLKTVFLLSRVYVTYPFFIVTMLVFIAVTMSGFLVTISVIGSHNETCRTEKKYNYKKKKVILNCSFHFESH